jgi:hypothetical protein
MDSMPSCPIMCVERYGNMFNIMGKAKMTVFLDSTGGGHDGNTGDSQQKMITPPIPSRNKPTETCMAR